MAVTDTPEERLRMRSQAIAMHSLTASAADDQVVYGRTAYRIPDYFGNALEAVTGTSAA